MNPATPTLRPPVRNFQVRYFFQAGPVEVWRMERLFFILEGIGSVFGGFGASRPYRIPQRGDRAQDLAHMRADVARVGADLRLRADRALRSTARK